MPAPQQMEKKQRKLSRLVQNGQFKDAIKILAPICKKQPRVAQNWLSLASLYGQAGDFQNVIKTCERVLQLDKSLVIAHSLMGNAYAALGRTREAGQQYQLALQHQPDNPGILNNYGSALFIEGRHEEARDTLIRALEKQPNYADAHNNLGNVYKALNEDTLAIQHYKTAAQLDPLLTKPLLNLGDMYLSRVGHPETAETYYRTASEADPNDLEARTGLINAMRYLGRLEEALQLVREAKLQHPGKNSLQAIEADILDRLGDYEAAHQLALKVDAHTTAIEVLLRSCHRFDTCAEAITRAEKALASDTIPATGKETLHFGLGKLLDRQGAYDEAFFHYRAANQVFDIPFDQQLHNQKIAELKSIFNADSMDRLPHSSITTSQPIFIVGMPRSGTSLTEQILASHPEVAGAGELNEINDIVNAMGTLTGANAVYPGCIPSLTTEQLDGLAQRYLDKLRTFAGDEPYITDKMPHNFMNIGIISLLFPNSRIIHCIRDPRDTCLSIYFQKFGWVHPYGTRLEWLGEYYQAYASLMQHWHSINTIPILDVHYEDMVQDQEATTRRILEFCNLPWEESCLQFHKSRRVVATASFDQVRQKLYTGSKARWKNYEKHITPLITALGDAI